MKLTWKHAVFGALGLGLIALLAPVAMHAPTIYRIVVGLRVYETEPPVLPDAIARPAILVFSKTNGFRHEEAIPAANAMFEEIARARDWGFYATENGAVFNAEQLARFDAVVFNSVSGDVFRPEQRQALQDYVEAGGGFVAIHGSGGDPRYDWAWYVNDLIGAQFIGHPMNPQFQQGTLKVEDKSHPASRDLPADWVRTEEWYSFARSARREGYHVLATLNESSYRPDKLAMGADHPMIWWHCQGRGRALYSALGHRGEAYGEPAHRNMLEGALAWALRLDGEGCE
jgi:uncharacterized protein